ncbi:MAG TPA: LptA/OstA family protein, partial [Vicinamibacterales bacterium]|nr:LptA/OstA family protein [Vicinamibacterales bacterium]
LTLPERSGRTVTITANEAEVTPAASNSKSPVGTAKMKGSVRLTTSDGITVMSEEGTYDDREGMLQMPGAVTFSRGRMTGSGVGATYDCNRDVLWLLEQARINVQPDPKTGGGAEATAGSAGLARREHYLRLTRTARIVTEGRTIEGDDITVRFTEDDERVRSMEVRTNSRITGAGAGAQTMTARDIDLMYAEDGKALQSARLMENAVLQLPGDGGGGPKRIAARMIDLGMSPDGATLTHLAAHENVQVDLPADGDLPAKRIRSSSLAAAGQPGAGLQEATFTGNVDYRETRAARPKLAAVNRTARAERLIVRTRPGLGPIEQADFQGKVRITDPPQVTAEAPRIVYQVEKDAIELFPSDADAALVPHVTDGQIDVAAQKIQFALGTRKLAAETRVRSTVQPRNKKDPAATNGGGAQPQGRVPSMLKQDQPVFVTSERLAYDGTAARAIYEGTARLWQGDSEIRGARIEIDDKTGNLAARGGISTVMLLQDTDPKTGKKTVQRTVGRGDTFDYEEAKRLAVYVGTEKAQANIVGPQGDVTADRIELYLKEGTNELERAVARGKVYAKESNRNARGDHLTYTAADDLYVMTGTPVVAIEETPPSCKRTTAPTITFKRSVENVQVASNSPVASKTEEIACTAEKRF